VSGRPDGTRDGMRSDTQDGTQDGTRDGTPPSSRSAGPTSGPAPAPGAGTAAGSTHFGFSAVPAAEKAGKVAEVFDSVAGRYDVMNDLMSVGLHRAWKAFTVRQAALRPGMKVLDIAGGTGDLARAFARRVGPEGEVWLTDINGSMLAIGRDRLLDDGLAQPVAQCDAEALPFVGDRFDRVCVAFGLRNMTRKEAALREMLRVLKPGGRLLVLEFSKVWKPLAPAYDAYSFGVLPRLGRAVAGDADSYRYLAESIRMHPDQEGLKAMMEAAGFHRVRYFNLTLGVVALHEGIKL
jgi:demethylmenaquinone methyltransferase/2-methoxy-6-polyprenyl-1,4-benzoquinol methylase